MGLVLRLVLRHERRRSDARAALLADLAAAAAADSPADAAFADEFDQRNGIATSSAMAAFGSRSPRRRRDRAWPRRLAIACGLARGGGSASARSSRVRGDSAPRAGCAAERQPRRRSAARLDLLSLQAHAGAGDAHDHRARAESAQRPPLAKITATAMLFGADGAFIASGRTPLDLTTLRPGDESASSSPCR